MADLIDDIDAKAEKATARPWEHREVGEIFGGVVGTAQIATSQGGTEPFANADFIVALVNAWSHLRDRLRAAEALCELIDTTTQDGPWETYCDIGHAGDCDHCAAVGLVQEWRKTRGEAT